LNENVYRAISASWYNLPGWYFHRRLAYRALEENINLTTLVNTSAKKLMARINESAERANRIVGASVLAGRLQVIL